MYKSLKNHFRKYIDLSENEIEVIISCLKHKKINKKEYLLHEGQICTSSSFVDKGCFRSFYIDKKGNEQITQFAIENWWITDYDSFINQNPSQLYIQALEDSEIIRIEKNTLEKLYIQIPQLERYFRIISQIAYIASQRRIQYLFSLSGEELYDQVCKKLPDFVQRVPQYMLASYLGFTPEFLSKIRGKKRS